MKIITHVSIIFFCTVLILAMYTIPNNVGLAYAHQSPKHESCWDTMFNAPYLVLSVIGFLINIFLLIKAGVLAASIFFIPAAILILTVEIPFFQLLFLKLKIIATIIAGIPLARGCDPMVVPPPVTEAGTVHLDCNNDQGFTFTEIENNIDNFDTKGKYSRQSFIDGKLGQSSFEFANKNRPPQSSYVTGAEFVVDGGFTLS